MRKDLLILSVVENLTVHEYHSGVCLHQQSLWKRMEINFFGFGRSRDVLNTEKIRKYSPLKKRKLKKKELN